VLKGKVGKRFSKPRDLSKTRHSDSLEKSQLTISQAMMKKGDVVFVADDEFRTSASQNRATSTLCTEELSQE
jgi:pantoate kinase